MKNYSLTKVTNTENDQAAIIFEGDLTVNDDERPYSWSAEVFSADSIDLFSDILDDRLTPNMHFQTERHGLLEGRIIVSKIDTGTRGDYIYITGTGPLTPVK